MYIQSVRAENIQQQKNPWEEMKNHANCWTTNSDNVKSGLCYKNLTSPLLTSLISTWPAHKVLMINFRYTYPKNYKNKH
jgi:hypothetical protein